MRYIIGLGNPGIKYEQTRHNIGFKAVESIAQKLNLSWQEKSKLHAMIARSSTDQDDCTLVKPISFMNLSGQPTRAVLNFFQDIEIKSKDQKIDDLFVVFDDLDLEMGSYKLQFAKGPHGHNGLNSIYEYLGTTQFWHVRLGVDGRKNDRTIPPNKYVLQPFEKDEQELAKSMVEQTALNLIKLLHATF